MNKRKVLDSARKLAQKGAKQKALKEYEKLLAADPRDAKLHLEVGDAYRRWGQVEDAINQYTRVATQFRQDGFDARAVAVYKQILNLDSKRYATFVSLGELYQHMGLDAEAIGALQTAADGYHKEGDKPKALELLRKMAALDPANTTSRMKVADLLKQEGLSEDAVAEYREVAAELKRQGANENVPTVLERILEVEPDSIESLASLADCYMELSRADRAEPCAVKLAELEGDSDAYERLCNVYRVLGDDEKLSDATRKLAKLYRDRGDEDQAREIMQRLPTEAVVETGGLGKDQSELEEPVLSDEQVLDDDEFLLGDDDGDGDLELTLDNPSDPPSEAAPETATADDDGAAALPIPDGDPEQLFAEATVYLRYGKTEQAIASLKGILVQQPDHRQALEKLGEAMIEKGEETGAVANWRRAAELAAEAGEASALDLLRDRIGAIDPAAASELPTIEAPPAASSKPADDDGFDLDLDLDVESGMDEAPAEDATDGFDLDLDAGGEGLGDAIDAAAGDVQTDAADDLGEGFELDLDSDDDLAAAMVEAAGGDDGASDDAGVDSDAGGEFEIDLDSDDLGIDVEIEDEAATDDVAAAAGVDPEASNEGDAADGGFDLNTDELDLGVDIDVETPAVEEAAVATPAASASANEHSTSTAARIEEELEEAEFYLQQDLDAEAEAIYRRILDVAPGHPSALLRLGELAARKGRDPADLAAGDAGTEKAAEPAPDSSDLDLDDGAFEFDIDDAATDEAAATEGVSAGPDPDLFDVGDDSAAFADDAGAGDETEDSTEVAMLDDDALAASAPASNPLLSEEMADAALADSALGEPGDSISEETMPEPASPAAAPQPIAAAASDDDSFDLAAELAGAFEDANAPEPAAHGDTSETGEVLSKVDDGFESIFSDFKKGVSAALEEGDYETRYDLGIAYREMGLYEDAIAEFRVCLDSTNRRLESLHMMGLSALDLGRFPDAVSHFEQALATPELAENRKVGIYFDLGRAHEASGDLTRAESVYCEVEALDGSFPGLRERLEAVRSGGGSSPLELAGGRDDEFENFGDLFSSDDEDEAPLVPVSEPEAEAFENFDDVITDVEADMVEAEEAEHVPEPEAVDDDPPTDPGTSGRRKKKISFV